MRNPDETVYENARALYESYGYQMPVVVFHNVNSWQMQTPVSSVVIYKKKMKGAFVLEFYILNFIQEYLRTPWLDCIVPFITRLGDKGMIWIILAVILLVLPKTRKTGAAVAIALVLETLCCNVILKPLVGRIRPYDVNTAVSLLITAPKDYSFPSGHTAASFAAISALFFRKNQLWIPALILGMAIAFSRIYLYVHYPSDVLAGILLGMMTGWIGSMLVKIYTDKERLL